KALPVQALLDGGDGRGPELFEAGAEAEPAEQAALGRDQRQVDLLAVALLQHGAQLAQRIDQAELEAAPAGPEFAREQSRFVGLQLAGAALAHTVLEAVMDLGLQALQPLDILGLLGPEGIEHRLALARRVHAALD